MTMKTQGSVRTNMAEEQESKNSKGTGIQIRPKRRDPTNSQHWSSWHTEVEQVSTLALRWIRSCFSKRLFLFVRQQLFFF